MSGFEFQNYRPPWGNAYRPPRPPWGNVYRPPRLPWGNAYRPPRPPWGNNLQPPRPPHYRPPRPPSENDHWELQQEFMEEYRNMFSEDRLLYLAQAYADIVLMTCRYPDPVMAEISHLSKPLQMHRRFQDSNDSFGAERPIKREQSGNEQLLNEDVGKPLKKIKLYTDFEDVQPYKSLQSPNLPTNLVQDQPNSLSMHQLGVNEKRIIDYLGWEFIQNFVKHINPKKFAKIEGMKIFSRINDAVRKMNMEAFEIDFDVSPTATRFPGFRTPQYVCNFSIRKCFLATGKDKRKQNAKVAAAMGGIDTLIKLVSEVISISCGENMDSQQFSPIAEEDVKNLELLNKSFGNAIPTNRYFDETIKKLHLEQLISFERVLTRAPDNNNQWHKVNICKILYKDILISSGCHDLLHKAKLLAFESAFNKLKNLSNCGIRNNEIVECFQKQSDIAPLASNPGCSKEVKTDETSIANSPFTVNKSLFDSSIQDSFVIMDILDNNSVKDVKEILLQSASFCKKTFTFDIVKIGAIPSLRYRADLVIDGIAIGSGTESEEERAKIKACEIAFDTFRKKYYVIQMKSVSKKSTLDQESSNCCYYNGMEDIIFNVGEELGLIKQVEDTNYFKKKIDTVLTYFSESDSLSDLIFAYNKDFNMAESKDIEMVAEKYNLHTTNLDLGNDELMTLVVRRKYSIEELLNYLVNVGGSDIKYKLVDATISMQDPFKKIKKPFKTSLWTKKK